MGSNWTSTDEEVVGIYKAARNLDYDANALAEYIYDRCSAFYGGDHQQVAVTLILAGLAAMQHDPSARAKILALRDHGMLDDSYTDAQRRAYREGWNAALDAAVRALGMEE